MHTQIHWKNDWNISITIVKTKIIHSQPVTKRSKASIGPALIECNYIIGVPNVEQISQFALQLKKKSNVFIL